MDPEQRSHSLLRCIGSPDSLMSAELQAQCLPADLRGDRRTVKLVKVRPRALSHVDVRGDLFFQERKRKLFHSQVYESELGMKKLYIQVRSE